VEAVVAQRLVRRLCKECRQPVATDAEILRQAGFPMDRLAGKTIFGPHSCEACRMTGFRGRVGIFEVLQVTETVRSLIIARSSSNEIKQQSIGQGMTTLRDDGWNKVLLGVTTVEEVLQATEENE
jgi:type II secretory ATPase GspE/PulE/Tfp pilus assembly ATPase PilB-like protein